MARRALAVATATMMVTVSVVAPANAQPVVIEQGNRFATSSDKSCTIGLNDASRGVSYSAAHCGKRGDLVFLVDENGYRQTTPVGTFEPSARYDSRSASNDWSVIKWYPGVTVKPNRFGGDYYPAQNLKPGEKICFHGYTTHGAGDASSCGRFIGNVGENVYYEAPVQMRSGDSGGPVFAPGKGTVGVVAGNTTISDGRRSITLGRAAGTSDGPRVDLDSLNQLVAPIIGKPVRRAVQEPGDPKIATASEGSSKPLQIVGPMIAIFALALPFLGGLVKLG